MNLGEIQELLGKSSSGGFPSSPPRTREPETDEALRASLFLGHSLLSGGFIRRRESSSSSSCFSSLQLATFQVPPSVSFTLVHVLKSKTKDQHELLNEEVRDDRRSSLASDPSTPEREINNKEKDSPPPHLATSSPAWPVSINHLQLRFPASPRPSGFQPFQVDFTPGAGISRFPILGWICIFSVFLKFSDFWPETRFLDLAWISGFPVYFQEFGNSPNDFLLAAQILNVSHFSILFRDLGIRIVLFRSG